MSDVSREGVERRLLAHRAEPDADWSSYRLAAISAGAESVPLRASVRLEQRGADVEVDVVYHQVGLPLTGSKAWFDDRLPDARRLLRQALGAPAEPGDHALADGISADATAGPQVASGEGQQTPPTTLPGPSSERLRRRGYRVIACGGLVGVVNAVVAGVARNQLAAGLGFGVLLVLVSVGAYVGARGLRKAQAERQRGYTVDLRIGRLHPDLWILDFRTLAVCFRPEPAPVFPPDQRRDRRGLPRQGARGAQAGRT